MENSEIKNKVNQVCNDFTSSNQTQISINTRKLIIDTLIAIKEDPHPRWKTPHSEAGEQNESETWDGVINTYLSALPMFLKQIEVTERAEGKITYFHALHWLAEGLQAMCLIEK